MYHQRWWPRAAGISNPCPTIRTVAKLFLVSTCATLIFHFPILQGYFQADDFVWLFHSDWASVRASFCGNWGLGIAYRPLARLSYALDWNLFGANATGWHAVNLFLHAGNGTQIGMIARSLRWNWRKTWTLVLLFLAFPMDWETVDWISGRTGLLSLLFCLLSFQMWLWLAGRKGRFGPSVLWFAFFQTLGLLCYEPVLVWPLVFLCSAWPLTKTGLVKQRMVLTTTAVGATAAAAFWVGRYWLLGSATVRTDATSSNLILGVLRDLLAVGAHAWRDLTPYGFLIVAAVLVSGLIRRRSRFSVLCLSAAVALSYAPFVGVAGFTERFAYISSAPLMFAVTLSMSGFSTRVRSALVIGLIGIFGLMSVLQADEMRLAGTKVVKIVAAMRSLSDLRGGVLIEGVPDQNRGKYLLMGAFEEVAHKELPALNLIARTNAVGANPSLYDALATNDVVFMRYNSTAGAFDREIALIDLSPSIRMHTK